MRWARRMKFSPFSMRNKLIIGCFLLILIGILLTAVVTYLINNGHIKKIVAMSMENSLQLINTNLNYSFHDADRLSIEIASNLNVQNALKTGKTDSITDYLTLKVAGYANLQGIYVFDNLGNAYYASKSYNMIAKYNFLKEKWVKNIRDDEKLIIPTHLEEHVYSNSIYVYSVARAIADSYSGRRLGYVKLDFTLSQTQIMFSSNRDITQGEVFILDRLGRYFYHPNLSLIGFPTNAELWSFITSHDKGSYLIHINKQKYWLTFTYSPFSDLFLMSLIPTKLFTGPSTLANKSIVIIIGVGFFISFIYAILFSLMIYRPIVHLRRHMKMVEMGDLSVQIQLRTKDEIGELTISFNKMILRLREHIDQIYNYQLANKLAQLEAIRAQINPHFLYNTLEAIDSLSTMGENENVSKMTRALSSIFQYSISTIDGAVPLGNELQITNKYLYIQRVRFQNRYRVDIENAEPFLECEILPFILQPIIENTFKHGFQNIYGNGYLTIRFASFNHCLSIHFQDNGNGISLERWQELNAYLQSSRSVPNEVVKGKGLKSVNDRLRLTYGVPFGLEVLKPNGDGFQVVVTMPFITKQAG